MGIYAVALNVQKTDENGMLYLDLDLHMFTDANSPAEALGLALMTYNKDTTIQNWVVKGDDNVDIDILYLIGQGEQILAIKKRREKTGEGLKEAKDYCHEIRKKYFPELHKKFNNQ